MIDRVIPKPSELVQQYIDSVLDGTRTVGMHEQAVVNGYLRDREHAAERGWFFQPDMAEAAVNFFPACLRHSVGEWGGEPFVLAPWQAFVTWNLFGWYSADEKLRRFRRAYVTVARKNGKTTWGAGIALLMTFFDRDWHGEIENVGQVYCSATKREQAALLWHEAVRMLHKSKPLLQKCIVHGERQISGGRVVVTKEPWAGTSFTPLGSDSKGLDGLNPSCVIKDELHEWRDTHRGVHEKLSTGGASRRQPLEIIITTAGDDNSQIWMEEHDFCQRVARGMESGQIVDDSIFPFICQLDDNDEPFRSENWPKANPNIGESVRLKYLQSQADEAAAKPAAYNQFLRYHCNLRVASFDQAYPPHIWKKGANRKFPAPERGDLCYIGFDLGLTDDWCAVSLVFPQQYRPKLDGKRRAGPLTWRYVIQSRAWCCAGSKTAAIDYSRPPFSTWIREGLLDFQKAERVDRLPLRDYVIEAMQTYNVKSVAYDKYSASEIAQDLAGNHGAPITDFHQTYLRFNEPIRTFERALDAKQIDHGDDPVLNWQAGNCQVVYDPSGRCKLNKGNDVKWKKIDGMVAVLMAFGEAIVDQKAEHNTGVLVV